MSQICEDAGRHLHKGANIISNGVALSRFKPLDKIDSQQCSLWCNAASIVLMTSLS